MTSVLPGFQDARPMTASSRPSTAKSLGPSNPYPDLPSLNERVSGVHTNCVEMFQWFAFLATATFNDIIVVYLRTRARYVL